jgi:hypothetical protein
LNEITNDDSSVDKADAAVMQLPERMTKKKALSRSVIFIACPLL